MNKNILVIILLDSNKQREYSNTKTLYYLLEADVQLNYIIQKIKNIVAR